MFDCDDNGDAYEARQADAHRKRLLAARRFAESVSERTSRACDDAPPDQPDDPADDAIAGDAWMNQDNESTAEVPPVRSRDASGVPEQPPAPGVSPSCDPTNRAPFDSAAVQPNNRSGK